MTSESVIGSKPKIQVSKTAKPRDARSNNHYFSTKQRTSGIVKSRDGLMDPTRKTIGWSSPP